MATIVFLHAHPDDEASGTSGTMTRLSREGHRVVVVYGTGGEHGTAPEDLPEGTSLAEFRRGEAEASARVTGTERIEWLGYVDSGMQGWEQNGHDRSFHGADLDEAGGRLADLLDEEDADVLVTYDWHGGYGHPDHVKVHQVAHRAADLAAQRPRLLESTMNRDAMRIGYQQALEAGQGDESLGPRRPHRRRRAARHARGTDLVEGRRHAGHRVQAGVARMPRQPDERRGHDAGDARGRVPGVVRDGVLHRARAARGHGRRVAVRRPRRRLREPAGASADSGADGWSGAESQAVRLRRGWSALRARGCRRSAAAGRRTARATGRR